MAPFQKTKLLRRRIPNHIRMSNQARFDTRGMLLRVSPISPVRIVTRDTTQTMEIFPLDCVPTRNTRSLPPMKVEGTRLDAMLDPLAAPWTVRSLLHEKYDGRPGWDAELAEVRGMPAVRFAGFVSALLRGVRSPDVIHDVLAWADRIKAARVAPSVAEPAAAA